MGEADLRVETDCDVRADEDKLFEVLENLFRNAIEHGGTDVTVTIGSIEGGDSEDFSGFYVEDDGTGIPPDKREKAFEDDYSTSQHGTGYGLTIIQRIIDSHNWEISVSDGSDDGARFEITGVEQVVSEPLEHD